MITTISEYGNDQQHVECCIMKMEGLVTYHVLLGCCFSFLICFYNSVAVLHLLQMFQSPLLILSFLV